jgi:hypothetical protein
MADRPVRGCDGCDAVDDHPRHVIYLEPGKTAVRHMDCCAANGCATCAAAVKATDGAKGPALLSAINAGALADI